MKRSSIAIILLLLLIAGALPARAQYYQIANQIPGLLQPALSGSFNYKGFVEVSGLAGIGTNRANFAGISTSQGFQYASWFFMGAGLGVDVVHSSGGDRVYGGGNYGVAFSKTKAMIPVFSDFRFNIGRASGPSAFIDLKLGASWLIGDSYLDVNQGYLSTATQFYFRPSLGIRIPINARSPGQAINIGLTYQLLTGNSSYYTYDNSVTLSSLGLTLGVEW